MSGLEGYGGGAFSLNILSQIMTLQSKGTPNDPCETITQMIHVRICTYIYRKVKPTVGKYSIHGASGKY